MALVSSYIPLFHLIVFKTHALITMQVDLMLWSKKGKKGVCVCIICLVQKQLKYMYVKLKRIGIYKDNHIYQTFGHVSFHIQIANHMILHLNMNLSWPHVTFHVMMIWNDASTWLCSSKPYRRCTLKPHCYQDRCMLFIVYWVYIISQFLWHLSCDSPLTK